MLRTPKWHDSLVGNSFSRVLAITAVVRLLFISEDVVKVSVVALSMVISSESFAEFSSTIPPLSVFKSRMGIPPGWMESDISICIISS